MGKTGLVRSVDISFRSLSRRKDVYTTYTAWEELFSCQLNILQYDVMPSNADMVINAIPFILLSFCFVELYAEER
jgi:hypothetical protein